MFSSNGFTRRRIEQNRSYEQQAIYNTMRYTPQTTYAFEHMQTHTCTANRPQTANNNNSKGRVTEATAAWVLLGDIFVYYFCSMPGTKKSSVVRHWVIFYLVLLSWKCSSTFINSSWLMNDHVFSSFLSSFLPVDSLFFIFSLCLMCTPCLFNHIYTHTHSKTQLPCAQIGVDSEMYVRNGSSASLHVSPNRLDQPQPQQPPFSSQPTRAVSPPEDSDSTDCRATTVAAAQKEMVTTVITTTAAAAIDFRPSPQRHQQCRDPSREEGKTEQRAKVARITRISFRMARRTSS